MDTTPYWVLIAFIVLAVLFLFGMELVKQYRDPENTHYDIRELFGKDKQ